MKTIMMLGAGLLQIPAIRKAKELGLSVIAADYDPGAPGFQYADVCLPVSTLDEEEIYRQALRLRPDRIITSTSDAPVYVAACVSRRLGLESFLSPEDARCATNKAFMRRRLAACGVPIPEFYIAENKDEFDKALSHFPDRCVIKPADSAGSRGVRLFRRGGERSSDEVYAYSRKFSRSGTVLVEEFLEGPEVSVEGFSVDGVETVAAVTDKLVSAPPYFVEIGHSQPSRLDPETLRAILNIAAMAAEALHICNGPSHTEVKITKSGPKIVEIAARLGGDFITSRLVPLSTGIDMVGNSIRQEIGLPIDLTPGFHRGSAVRFFTSGDGILQKAEGLEEARRMQGVEEAVLYRKAGDAVHQTESSGGRLGHVIASADTAEGAMRICERAKSSVRLTVTSVS